MAKNKAGRPYYGVYFPDQTVTIGKRFFFFNTLYQDSPDLAHDYLSAMQNSLRQQNESLLKSAESQEALKKGSNKTRIIQMDYLTKIREFLATWEEREKNNELMYFARLANNPEVLNILTPQAKIDFINMIQSSTINSTKFTAIINMLLHGNAETAGSIIQYEDERLHFQRKKIVKAWEKLSELQKERYREQVKENEKKAQANADKAGEQRGASRHTLEQKAMQLFEKDILQYYETHDVLTQKELFYLKKDTFSGEVYKLCRSLMVGFLQRPTIMNTIKSWIKGGDKLTPESLNFLSMSLINIFRPLLIKRLLTLINANATQKKDVRKSLEDRHVVDHLLNEIESLMTKGKTIMRLSNDSTVNSELDAKIYAQLQSLMAEVEEFQEMEKERAKFSAKYLTRDTQSAYIKEKTNTGATATRNTISNLGTNDSSLSQKLLKQLEVMIQLEENNAETTKKRLAQLAKIKARMNKDRTSVQQGKMTWRKMALETVANYFYKTDSPFGNIRDSHGNRNNVLVSQAINLVLNGTTEPLLTVKTKFNAEFSSAQDIYSLARAAGIKEIKRNRLSLTHAAAKSDTLTVLVGGIDIGINDKNLKQIADNIAEELTQAFSKPYEEQYSLKKVFHPYSIIHRLFDDVERENATLQYHDESKQFKQFQANEFNVARNTNNIIGEISHIIAQTDSLRGPNKDLRQEHILNIIKNTIVIHSSVKSYTNDFTTSQGFHGGSIGGSVEKQIQNIVTMQKLGGITMADAEWLTSAVYNSGPGLLYSKGKPTVEMILSSVAAMLLFEDYGAQAVWYKQASEPNKDPLMADVAGSLASNRIHIYRLNDVYVPASYILHLTKIGFDQMARNNNLKLLEHNQGIRATIHNDINITDRVIKTSKKDKISYTKVKNASPVTSPQEWFDTFERNRKRVSINIVFLSGFLDILDKLDKQMRVYNTNTTVLKQ